MRGRGYKWNYNNSSAAYFTYSLWHSHPVYRSCLSKYGRWMTCFDFLVPRRPSLWSQSKFVIFFFQPVPHFLRLQHVVHRLAVGWKICPRFLEMSTFPPKTFGNFRGMIATRSLHCKMLGTVNLRCSPSGGPRMRD